MNYIVRFLISPRRKSDFTSRNKIRRRHSPAVPSANFCGREETSDNSIRVLDQDTNKLLVFGSVDDRQRCDTGAGLDRKMHAANVAASRSRPQIATISPATTKGRRGRGAATLSASCAPRDRVRLFVSLRLGGSPLEFGYVLCHAGSLMLCKMHARRHGADRQRHHHDHQEQGQDAEYQEGVAC